MNSRFCSPGRILPYILYLILAFVLLLCWKPAQAQHARAASQTPKVGDMMPDVLITNIENYKATEAKISDFKGKLLILDFWASWCGVCVSMLPRIDSLQKQFNTQIQILPVAYQDAVTINTFLARYQRRTGRRIALPEVMQDSVLHAMFPHKYVPHYVWIDKNSVIIAITGKEEVTSEKIAKALSGQSHHLVQRQVQKSVPYDSSKPLLANGNGGGGENLLYHSLLTGYTQGLSAGLSYRKPDSLDEHYKITLRNLPIARLYQEAFGERKIRLGSTRTIIEIDQDILNAKDFSQKICYELITRSNEHRPFFDLMRDDLRRMYPQYIASMENKKTRCLALRRIPNAVIPKSKGGRPSQSYGHFDGQGVKITNSSLEILVYNLSTFYLQHSTLPIVDDTGITDNVDLNIDASLSDVAAINKQLAPQGLSLQQVDMDIDMLVIRAASSLSDDIKP
jgi:thiol-disulfide isomerase/thioredoxin